jgi:hypothetical protein
MTLILLPKHAATNGNRKAKIIKLIIHELVGSFGLKLNPSLECGVETLAGPSRNGHIFIIGALHMSRMAEFLPVESISSATHGSELKRLR